MAPKTKQEAQNPLILRCNRLMEAFAKSNEERDFYLDRMEGFLVYVDLDKPHEELELLEKELEKNAERYCLVPKLTFYETIKIMEGFVNEKVYDIDTKEKLLDIIQSKEARENFLEFIYDHHTEYDKWQQFYQERSRIRIIEWLRQNNFHFVFEEDLELPKSMLEKLKRDLFQTKAGKDLVNARKTLFTKAKTYYSNEALNPRPKRGRPPKQAVKLEIEPQITTDIYTTVPSQVRPFLFIPDINTASAITFSSKFDYEEESQMNKRLGALSDKDLSATDLSQKLATLRSLSTRWMEPEAPKKQVTAFDDEDDFDDDEDDFDDEDDDFESTPKSKKKPAAKAAKKPAASKKSESSAKATKKPVPKAKAKPAATAKAKPKAKPASTKPKAVINAKAKPGAKPKAVIKSKPKPKR